MGRISKIARLPRAIREELNWKINDGDRTAAELTEWLNALPEVRAVLEKDFEGKPVNEQNICDWKKGGYEVWLRRQAVIEAAEYIGETEAVVSGEQLVESLATMMVMELMRQLRESWSIEDAEKRRKVVFAVGRQLAQIQRNKLAEQARVQRARREEDRAEKEWKKVQQEGLEPENPVESKKIEGADGKKEAGTWETDSKLIGILLNKPLMKKVMKINISGMPQEEKVEAIAKLAA